MTKIHKKVATALAAGSLLLNVSLPAFASTTLILNGNGSDTLNDIQVLDTKTTTVVQSNQTDVDNNIQVSTNTGGNVAKDNTGGDVHVETGDADANVQVLNELNSNVANVENCGGCAGDTLIEVSENGTGSENWVGLEDNSTVAVFQENVADIDNDVNVDLETGNNRADDNTGGAVVVLTGDAEANVAIGNQANANTAMVAGGGDEGGGTELIVRGNGSDSSNGIGLGLGRLTSLTQSNLTDIDNKVGVYAGTGNNQANDNTGGDVAIGTGDADINAIVDNMSGFNHAYIDDCCFDDILAKVAGNGTNAESSIEAVLDQDLQVFQDNSCGHGWGYDWPRPESDRFWWPHWDNDCFDNDLSLDAVTGDNRTDDSTGDTDSDPLIITGDSDVEAQVGNSGGSNVYGDYMPSHNSGNWGGLNVDLEVSFDLEDLLAALLG